MKVEIDLDSKGWNNVWKKSEGIFRMIWTDRLLERYRSFRKPGMGPAEERKP